MSVTILYNHHWNTIRTRSLQQIKVVYDFFKQFGRNIEFQLGFRRKASKDKPEPSGTEFLEKFFVNKCVLSDSKDNTSDLLNRGGTLDLNLLRTLLVICYKSQEPSFWVVINYFISISKLLPIFQIFQPPPSLSILPNVSVALFLSRNVLLCHI